MVSSGETGLKTGVDSGLGHAAVRKVLLICGVLSSLLYSGVVLILGTRWGAYSWAAQTVSELNAIGSPTRPLFLALGGVYTLLVIAFGVGVRGTESRRRFLRIAGVYAIAGFVTGLFFPMPLREAVAQGEVASRTRLARR